MIYFLRYSLVPAPDHPDAERLGEAVVLCWIDRASLAEADREARRDIAGQQWRVVKREAGKAVTAADYDNDDELRERYKQALTDKEVYHYHLSPRHPVFWVNASLRRGDETAEAHYFLCNEALRDEGDDVYDPAFWAGEREEAAFRAALEAIEEAGWEVTAPLEGRPCGRGDVPEELLAYYDEAEEGPEPCLVFLHDEAG
jgi:hypothetical protein